MAVGQLSLQADERCRLQWWTLVSLFVMSASQAVFLDESSVCRRHQLRRYGWAPRGQPARIRANLSRGLRFSVMGALDISGLFAFDIVEKHAVTAETFIHFFLDRVLLNCTPWPGPRSVIIMDNAAVHARDVLMELCNTMGVLLFFLPPYSPDYNPIEQVWNTVKLDLKRTRDPDQFFTLLLALSQHVGRDQRENFRSCGYWRD
jgi:hypothetical protein